MDYQPLCNMADLDYLNHSAFNHEDVRAGKVGGFALLDQFGVYEVVPASQSVAKHFLDTKWEVAERGGKLKCRLVGGEFKFLDPSREGTFAPASSALTSRLVDYLNDLISVRAGLDSIVKWKLKKQLPGQRTAATAWTDKAANSMKKLGAEQSAAMRNLFVVRHNEGAPLVVELHIDDMYGCQVLAGGFTGVILRSDSEHPILALKARVG
eukprot:4477776-Amphidinium_carterae.3